MMHDNKMHSLHVSIEDFNKIWSSFLNETLIYLRAAIDKFINIRDFKPITLKTICHQLLEYFLKKEREILKNK